MALVSRHPTDTSWKKTGHEALAGKWLLQQERALQKQILPTLHCTFAEK